MQAYDSHGCNGHHPSERWFALIVQRAARWASLTPLSLQREWWTWLGVNIALKASPHTSNRYMNFNWISNGLDLERTLGELCQCTTVEESTYIFNPLKRRDQGQRFSFKMTWGPLRFLFYFLIVGFFSVNAKMIVAVVTAHTYYCIFLHKTSVSLVA